MSERSRGVALKEWATIVHALLAGEQVIDLRKGGLRESERHFSLESGRFWLYPTVEHQRPELLKPPYRHWIDLAPGSPVGRSITIHGWAEIVAHATITDGAHLDSLAGKVIWTDDYAESRLKWKSRDPLWVLVLRAHCLDEPITVPWNDAYGGCTSWVDLSAELDERSQSTSSPALSDVAFEGRWKGVREAIPEELWVSA